MDFQKTKEITKKETDIVTKEEFAKIIEQERVNSLIEFEQSVKQEEEELKQKKDPCELYHSLRGKKEHPLYRTSNSVYGGKKPTQGVSNKWFGRDGDFTNTFCGTMYKDNSLNTSKTRSLTIQDPNF